MYVYTSIHNVCIYKCTHTGILGLGMFICSLCRSICRWCISSWSRSFHRRAPCTCGSLWGIDPSMYMLALHPVGSSVTSAGTRAYNEHLLHCYFVYPFKIIHVLQKGHALCAVFRCRRCQMTTQTWASSRFFGEHYLVNQTYAIHVLCILCMCYVCMLDQKKPYCYKVL